MLVCLYSLKIIVFCFVRIQYTGCP